MTEQEQAEYLGLAAAVGRLAMALKSTEEALAQKTREIEELKPKEEPKGWTDPNA